MSRLSADKGRLGFFRLDRKESLTRPERIGVQFFVIGAVVLDLVEIRSNSDTTSVSSLLGIASTLSFALYLWSPVLATTVLGGIVTTAFVLGDEIGTLLAGSIAAVFVLRLGSMRLILSYAAGLIFFNVLYANGTDSADQVSAGFAVYLIVAVLAGAVGLALRLAYARGHLLEDELAEQAEREREAVIAERRWIAGELHDSIAHYLTIIALHAQLLDDESVRPQSQEAIRIAARKALTDLRFVIQMAEDIPIGSGTSSGDLAEAIEEATDELKAAGFHVVCIGDPTDEGLPRGAEIVLARIVRESATNILKYAGQGDVVITLDLGEHAITLDLVSPLPNTPRKDLPSTGTGLNRMAERVLGVSGDFTAGPVGNSWIVSVQLPVGATPEPKPALPKAGLKRTLPKGQ